MAGMRTIVSTLGGTASVQLDVEPETTVAGLKELCSQHWRFPPLLQQLLVGDAEPNDAESLSALCPEGASELAITLQLPLAILEDGGDEHRRFNAYEALEAMKAEQGASAESSERAVQAAVASLNDPVAANRRLAVILLGDIAAAGDARVLTWACASLEDEEPQVICVALALLAARASSSDEGVAEAVIKCRTNARSKHGEDVGFASVRTLASLAEKGDRRCVEALCAALEDGDGYLRLLVLDVLTVAAEPGDEMAAAAVKAHLHENDGAVRLKALETYAKLAPRGDADGIAAVVESLKDKSAKLRCRAVIALSKIAPQGCSETAVSAVCLAAADSDADVRCVAVEVLPMVAAKGDALALAAIKACLEPEEDSNPDVVEAAKDALAALQAEAE